MVPTLTGLPMIRLNTEIIKIEVNKNQSGGRYAPPGNLPALQVSEKRHNYYRLDHPSRLKRIV